MTESVNCITCTVWVPRGAAHENPEKIEVTKEELKKLIEDTKESIDDIDDIDENDYSALEVEALEEDLKINHKERKKVGDISEDAEMEEDGEAQNAEEGDIEKEYDLANYDEEGGILESLKLGKLTVHASAEDDPYITYKEDDSESEKDNNKILPSDNLITVGHVEGDAAILEVYVYNSEESSLYVHHDMLLPAIPLCMEWLNYDPGEENLKPGNMVAVGTMSPVIEVWDLDLIDCLEPAYKLGQKARKKKKQEGHGHKDAVLCLGWNKEMEHILASGSVDKTVILWDLEKCQEAQKFTKFSGKVQDLQWHPKESHYLLTASCDKKVRMIDCLAEGNIKSWELDGEVESVTWDPTSSCPYSIYASTDKGSVYLIDGRKQKPLQRIQAHETTCTGVLVNPHCPGCLITVSEDKTVKIWDTASGELKLVEESNPNLGIIHTVSCSPDSPFVISLGGDNKSNNFKVWDIRESRKVRQRFYERMGLTLDEKDLEEEMEEANNVQFASNTNEASESFQDTFNGPNQRWRQNKPSYKKKGGHLDKRRFR